MKSSALENQKKHIKKIHPELIPAKPSIQQEVANKQAKYNSAASMSMVKFMKPLLNQHKVEITIWLYLNGILFNVSTSPEFWAIHEKHYDNYTILSWIYFNDNVAHDYRRFVIACAEKLTRRIQQHHGEWFLYVMHAMVKLNNGNNYLGASMSFMVDFVLYRLAVTLYTNNVSHSSNYNAGILQKILKKTPELDIYQFTKSMASDTTNSATAVASFFYPRAVQVDCEMHQFNLCLEYGFRICDNYRSKDMLDKNGVVIRNSSGKKFTRKVIVTPDG